MNGPLELAGLLEDEGGSHRARSGNERQSFLNKNDNDDDGHDGEHYVNKFYSGAGGKGDQDTDPFILQQHEKLLRVRHKPRPF